MFEGDFTVISQLVEDAAFARGAQLYAARQYWDAHEAWEALWRTTDDANVRLLVQALIQVAAALYKAHDKHDAEAAQRLLARAGEKLARVPDAVRGVNVAAFRAATAACRGPTWPAPTLSWEFEP